MEELITMAHGSGGKATGELVEKILLPAFDNPALAELHDGAKLNIPSGQLAFTTDSYVVSPNFFPGGNIGKLAVCGTVNDLAMTGAVPKYLSVGLILEEGFPIAKLKEIVNTMAQAAKEAQVQIVTGDTKVVPRGCGDGIYINTAGVGELIPEVNISASRVQPGDKIIISGYMGDHAATILATRHDLTIPADLQSDCAPLNGLVAEMLKICPELPMMRDATRGGVAAVLNEIACQAQVGILLQEDELPIRSSVQGFCDILGFDPLYLANEGKLIAVVPEAKANEVLAVMKAHQYGQDAAIIGEVVATPQGEVGLQTSLMGIRIIDMPQGELIPRIC